MADSIGTRAIDHENDIFQRLNASFCGFAKINLNNLQTDNSSPFVLDEKNVKRLCKVFENEGCLRLDPEHHVPVVIARDVLAGAVERAGTRLEALHNPDRYTALQLAPHIKLRVLHGQHRLRAAEQHLSPAAGRWWIVDLYENGRPRSLYRGASNRSRSL